MGNLGAKTTCGGSRHWTLRCSCPHRTAVAAPGETAHPGGGRENESPGSISQKRAQSALEPTSPISSPIFHFRAQGALEPTGPPFSRVSSTTYVRPTVKPDGHRPFPMISTISIRTLLPDAWLMREPHSSVLSNVCAHRPGCKHREHPVRCSAKFGVFRDPRQGD